MSRSRDGRFWTWILTAALVSSACTGAPTVEPTAGSSATTATPATSVATPAISREDAIADVDWDRFVGTDISDARQQLDNLGLVVGTNKFAGTISEILDPNTIAAPGDTVGLVTESVPVCRGDGPPDNGFWRQFFPYMLDWQEFAPDQNEQLALLEAIAGRDAEWRIVLQWAGTVYAVNRTRFELGETAQLVWMRYDNQAWAVHAQVECEFAVEPSPLVVSPIVLGGSAPPSRDTDVLNLSVLSGCGTLGPDGSVVVDVAVAESTDTVHLTPITVAPRLTPDSCTRIEARWHDVAITLAAPLGDRQIISAPPTANSFSPSQWERFWQNGPVVWDDGSDRTTDAAEVARMTDGALILSDAEAGQALDRAGETLDGLDPDWRTYVLGTFGLVGGGQGILFSLDRIDLAQPFPGQPVVLGACGVTLSEFQAATDELTSSWWTDRPDLDVTVEPLLADCRLQVTAPDITAAERARILERYGPWIVLTETTG